MSTRPVTAGAKGAISAIREGNDDRFQVRLLARAAGDVLGDLFGFGLAAG
jgi:hypothetical protein